MIFLKQTQLQHLQKQHKTSHKTSHQAKLQITNLFYIVSLHWFWLSFNLCLHWLISVVWEKHFYIQTSENIRVYC